MEPAGQECKQSRSEPADRYLSVRGNYAPDMGPRCLQKLVRSVNHPLLFVLFRNTFGVVNPLKAHSF